MRCCTLCSYEKLLRRMVAADEAALSFYSAVHLLRNNAHGQTAVSGATKRLKASHCLCIRLVPTF